MSTDTAANVFRSAATGVTIAGDTVFAAVWHNRNDGGGSREALLIALDRLSGRELWLVTLPVGASGGVSVSAAPLVFSDIVVFATTDGYVFGVNRTSQRVAWTFRSAQFVYTTQAQPASYEDAVYVDGGDERLYALDVHTGAVLWSVPSVSAIRDLLATARRIYIPSDNKLAIHDRADGRLVTTVTLPLNRELMRTAPAARGDQVFITRSSAAWSFREP